MLAHLPGLERFNPRTKRAIVQHALKERTDAKRRGEEVGPEFLIAAMRAKVAEMGLSLDPDSDLSNQLPMSRIFAGYPDEINDKAHTAYTVDIRRRTKEHIPMNAEACRKLRDDVLIALGQDPNNPPTAPSTSQPPPPAAAHSAPSGSALIAAPPPSVTFAPLPASTPLAAPATTSLKRKREPSPPQPSTRRRAGSL